MIRIEELLARIREAGEDQAVAFAAELEEAMEEAEHEASERAWGDSTGRSLPGDSLHGPPPGDTTQAASVSPLPNHLGTN